MPGVYSSVVIELKFLVFSLNLCFMNEDQWDRGGCLLTSLPCPPPNRFSGVFSPHPSNAPGDLASGVGGVASAAYALNGGGGRALALGTSEVLGEYVPTPTGNSKERNTAAGRENAGQRDTLSPCSVSKRP